MSKFEFWLDIQCAGQAACTLMGELEMPVRPVVGERISFHQDKTSSYQFSVERQGIGFLRENAVSVEVDEVSHYAARHADAVLVRSVLRCVELNVASIEDARAICDFLTSQIGLYVDPYGINTLDAE